MPVSDRDGTIDLLITTCTSVSQSTRLGSNCALNIAYNTQLPLCPSSSSFPLTSNPTANTPCQSPAKLCIADPHFSFSFSGPVCSFQSIFISIVDPPRLIGKILELCEHPDQRSSPEQHEAPHPQHVIIASP